MPQIINTNIASLTAQRNLNGSQSSLNTSLQRLSTGLRINSAKDDAAGLAISERFTTQIRGLNQAIRNANDGVSLAQTAEGALSTASDALQRIRELAVQSINDTNSSSDRQALNNEVNQLIAEVNRIAGSTQFNGQNILDGSLSTLTFQVGANQNQTIAVDGVGSRSAQLGARISTSGSIDETALAAAIAADNLVINGNSVSLTGDVSINGVSVTLVGGNGAADAATINTVSNQTGVTATANGNNIVLSNTSGADIVVQDGTTGSLGGADETFHAGVILAGEVANGAFTATGTFAVEAASTALGGVQADSTLAGVDVLNGTNANDALLTLDFALQQVSGLRAELGAVQSRFESTIANLSVTTENQSAARSRIRDADFAAETAELTRSQILQQAGIAILSQANAQPQNVLALLQ